ncbi:DKNYY domain-containing protein [Patescibacteria group bacterium]
MKNISNKLIIGICVVVLISIGLLAMVYGQTKDQQNDEVVEGVSVAEIQYVKLKDCPEKTYEDDSLAYSNPNYFMCKSYLTDGEYVYYHGIRAVAAPDQPLAPSFIATSSPNIQDPKLMGATIVEGVDLETFEIIYFDESLPTAQQNNMYSYARDKDFLYWEGKRFDGVDPNTFSILGRGFIKDKDSVYYWWKKLEGSDPETFEFLWSGFARDKNFVYRNNPEPEIFDGIDPATFEKIDDAYFKDKDAIYYRQKKIEGSDPATFEFLYGYTGKDSGNAYAKDKNAVYYLGKRLEGVDSETFEFLPNTWSKDKNFVYRYDGERVEGIDPATFEFVDKSTQYIKDKNGVYYAYGDNKKIDDMDSSTFKVLSGGYVKDKNFVWIAVSGRDHGIYSHKKIDGADANSFEVIERQYARDATTVYCSGNVMDGFDWGSVVMLQDNYIRDKNFVFQGCNKIEGADAKSFEVLSYKYSKDDNSVYYMGSKINDADAGSFEKLTCSCSKDKNNIYKAVQQESGSVILKFGNFDVPTFRIIGNCNFADKNGVYITEGRKIVGADPNTFEFLGGNYSKDAYRAYWDYESIDGVDIGTFRFNGGKFAKDKNTVYYEGKVYDDDLRASLGQVEILEGIRYPISDTLPGPVLLEEVEIQEVYPIGL